MEIAALITWILTALGGLTMLGMWLSHGGARQGGTTHLPVPVIFGHFALAALGLLAWIFYVVTDAKALAWTALILLLLVAVLGFTMLARWLPVRRAKATVTAGQPETAASAPPESHFPVAIVGGHGVLAVATLVLVLLSTLTG
ncbi:hypothetical protein ACIBHX_25070 [Nonomuraea sp. NPDC050536]|uniref:hypothetical protein n=1 Tax=Nonomuraea sp. NPDC050536 TaxID=3364366 RepID=UPI0037CBFD13